MTKTKRKAKRREAQLSEILDGPTEAQLANGHYVREFVTNGDTATKSMAHINQGGTPVIRWHRTGKLDDRQLAIIHWVQRLWDRAGTVQRVTAQYGERIASSASVELLTARTMEAVEDLDRVQGYIPAPYWSVFENVCRFDMPAGVAGGELGFGPRSSIDRAHTIVCFVADVIGMRERM